MHQVIGGGLKGMWLWRLMELRVFYRPLYLRPSAALQIARRVATLPEMPGGPVPICRGLKVLYLGDI